MPNQKIFLGQTIFGQNQGLKHLYLAINHNPKQQKLESILAEVALIDIQDTYNPKLHVYAYHPHKDQVPMQLNRRRAQSLTFRWIIDAARAEKGRPMHIKLANDLFSACTNEGKAVATRENTHRMADANKAFAHFAW